MKNLSFFCLILILNLHLACSSKNESSEQNTQDEQTETTSKAVSRLDPKLDKIISEDAKVEQISTGYIFVEGPLWHKDGYLIFSDIPANRIYKLEANQKDSVFLEKSGYTGDDEAEGELGSNGLAYNNLGKIIACQHGDRKIVKINPDKSLSVISDSYLGRRLNSPNDLVSNSEGVIFFTDPSWGLEKNSNKPKQEIPFNGVYRIEKGVTTCIDSTLTKPNGIALSPDEKTLYVSDINQIWWKYSLDEKGNVKDKAVFFDATKIKDKGYMDGIRVDKEGNVFGTGPGGVLIFNAEGKHLGTIAFPEIPANISFGDADNKTLYATCGTSIYKVKLK
jgi:gluconolactonase